jgi:DNA-binding MarR family transcriptional regulator
MRSDALQATSFLKSYFFLNCAGSETLFTTKLMAKFLFKLMPEKEELFRHFRTQYPEVAPIDLYTHMWMRMSGAFVAEQVDDFLAAHGITSGRFMTMMILESNPEGLKPSVLAGNLGVTQATVTGLIDGLEQTGFAKRREHAVDGRACVVALTEKGQKFISRVRPEFNQWVGRLYNGIDESEKYQLIGLLEKFYKSQKINNL